MRAPHWVLAFCLGEDGVNKFGYPAAENLELILFEHDAARGEAACRYGLRSFMTDWEQSGKEERQQGFDTEIRPGTLDDLRSMARVPNAMIWCRINRFGPHTVVEVEAAIEAGTGGVFLPMVSCLSEVEAFLQMVDGRCATGILVETVEAVRHAPALGSLPVDCVYFGLNDFAISRGGGSIFRALLDGSLERTRDAFLDQRFGFAGITAVDAGCPVPCKHLIEEMARLRCHFSFLRRSYRRDVASRDPRELLAGVQAYWRRCLKRTGDEIARDRSQLEGILRDVCRCS
jgi:hypothetical protein